MLTPEQISGLVAKHSHVNFSQFTLDFARAIEAIVAQDKDKRISELEDQIRDMHEINLRLVGQLAEEKAAMALAQDIIDTEPTQKLRIEIESVMIAARDTRISELEAEVKRYRSFEVGGSKTPRHQQVEQSHAQELANVTEELRCMNENYQGLMRVHRELKSAQSQVRDAALELRRCQPCNSPRTGDACHKCGSATVAPCKGWSEPSLPPIDRIRELAREVGYALGVHGTLERDLDVIAAPWTDDAIGNQALLEHIAYGLGARIIEVERKPLGRYAATLQMNGWYKNIDISVCPFLKEA